MNTGTGRSEHMTRREERENLKGEIRHEDVNARQVHLEVNKEESENEVYLEKEGRRKGGE